MEDTSIFLLVRKKRAYGTAQSCPKVSVDRATYDKLVQTASESGLTISEITRQAVAFALDRLEWVDE